MRAQFLLYPADSVPISLCQFCLFCEKFLLLYVYGLECIKGT